jgi:hypothetical protein
LIWRSVPFFPALPIHVPDSVAASAESVRRKAAIAEAIFMGETIYEVVRRSQRTVS